METSEATAHFPQAGREWSEYNIGMLTIGNFPDITRRLQDS